MLSVNYLSLIISLSRFTAVWAYASGQHCAGMGKVSTKPMKPAFPAVNPLNGFKRTLFQDSLFKMDFTSSKSESFEKIRLNPLQWIQLWKVPVYHWFLWGNISHPTCTMLGTRSVTNKPQKRT